MPPTQPADPLSRADVLLVTVTDVETKALFAALNATQGRTATHHHLGGKIGYDFGRVAGAHVWLVRSEMGTASPGGALATVGHAIATLHPRAVLLVGTAFGVDPKRQRIGDVLVARQLMLYDFQVITTGAGGAPVILPRGDRPSAAPGLLDRVRHGALSWSADAQVHVGLLLSGDKLIDHRALRDQLRQLEPEAIGGEMEGAGLYLAARQHQVDWIVIRAICDWADGRRGRNQAQRQQLAAHNAAMFAFHVLGQGGFGAAPARAVDVTQHIATYLQAVLPPAVQPQVPDLAALLAALATGALTPASLQEHVRTNAALQAAIEPLAGRTVDAGTSIIAFERTTVDGGVTIENAAGRDVVHITINILPLGAPP